MGWWSPTQTKFMPIPINMWPNSCFLLHANIQKSHLVHFGSIRSIFSSTIHFAIWSTLVVLGPIGPNWSYSILFSPIRLTLVIFNPLSFYLVYIGPIRSTMILFGPYVHFGPNLSIGSYSVLFGPPCSFLSYFVHLVHLCPLLSIFMHLYIYIYINYVWIACSKSKFITKNVYLKLVISKILSIIFIVTILLLSYINITF